MSYADLSLPLWRKSSRSIPNGECIELAWDGRTMSAIQDSKNPTQGTLSVDMRQLIQAIKDGY